MKLKLHTWTVPIYGDVVCFYTSRKTMGSDQRNLDPGYEKDLTPMSGVMMYLEHASGNLYMVGVFDKKVTTLAHECAHLAISILAGHGIPVTTENDEAFAYLLETCMQAFMSKHKVS